MSAQGGATIVGLKFRDGVVVAGERKASYGSYVVSVSVRKVFLLDKRVAVGFAGLVADAQGVLRILREEAGYYKVSVGRELGIRGIAKLLSNILYSYKAMPMETEAIVGGVEGGKPVLIVLDPLGSLIEDDFAAIGTGATIAVGVLEEGYREGMNRDDAVELALRSIRTAMKRDALSGGSIDLVVVSKEEVSERVYSG